MNTSDTHTDAQLTAEQTAQLTAEQQAVVNHQHGHAKVIAVAGAGKTTTLTHFIAARLQQGAQPRRMLVMMYNKAAQLDFEAKLQRLLPGQALPEVRTFHSLGLRIYQRLIQQGQLPAFQQKLLSDGEMENVVWRLLQQIADDDTKQEILSQKKKWVEPAMAFIDLVKAGLLPAHDVFETLDFPPACRIFIECFQQFEQWRKQQGRISFSDMIYDPVMFFLNNPEAAKQFGGHMQWILVDEYQDINEIQQYFLEVLYGGRGSVMVIGDPDQTIYEFRGSKPGFIVEQFDQRFSGQDNTAIARYELPHTFRYGHEISLLANHLISHNQEREPVLCLSHHSTPESVTQLHTTNNEAALILKLIQREAESRPLENIAVINRLWALCAPVELGLLQKKIPYQLHNSLSVLDRWELHIFWLLFEVAAGKFSERDVNRREQAWLHILTTPYPKIKRSVLEHIAKQLAMAEKDYGEAFVAAIPEELSKWQRDQLEDRAAVIANAEYINTSAYRIIQDYIDQTDLYQGIEDSAFSAQQIEDRQQTIKAFVAFIRDSQQMVKHAYDYLLELKQQRLQQENNTGVHLTSIHKSKGLEWPVVIIPGLNAHYFPYNPEGEFTTQASEESERRLLYVAMTRAKNTLHLITPSQTIKRQKNNNNSLEKISRFQREANIDHSQKIARAITGQQSILELVDKTAPWVGEYIQAVGVDLAIATASKSSAAEPAYAEQNPGNYIIDRKYPEPDNKQRVVHQVFGRGYILSEDERYLKVRFDHEAKLRTFDRKKAADFLQYDS
ncbi:ATP-dependent helicase [Bacterioplanoides sp. SCSIO 12839]|uniref:ATP-dependent helicase n=1 Tax=Bacterioplanoides sp. SCSIO 12839 TaxID=2829569 RepID=UPI002106920E|nr:ATP-dependent helicase [Bacterioplanoides sp. SCSIO 12839]UTW47383.1 ATP-dependent helicase [Bacterioplanoides sp. SCSIO 12839]